MPSLGRLLSDVVLPVAAGVGSAYSPEAARGIGTLGGVLQLQEGLKRRKWEHEQKVNKSAILQKAGADILAGGDLKTIAAAIMPYEPAIAINLLQTGSRRTLGEMMGDEPLPPGATFSERARGGGTLSRTGVKLQQYTDETTGMLMEIQPDGTHTEVARKAHPKAAPTTVEDRTRRIRLEDEKLGREEVERIRKGEERAEKKGIATEELVRKRARESIDLVIKMVGRFVPQLRTVTLGGLTPAQWDEVLAGGGGERQLAYQGLVQELKNHPEFEKMFFEGLAALGVDLDAPRRKPPVVDTGRRKADISDAINNARSIAN